MTHCMYQILSLTGNGRRQFLGGIRSDEAAESVRRVAVKDNEHVVGRSEELRGFRTAAVGEDATSVGWRGTITHGHRVETRRILHGRLKFKVLERQQHFL